MKPEQQRIAIAEAIGAVRGSSLGYTHGQSKEFYIADPEGEYHDLADWSKRYKHLFRYAPLNDLNAMHEAEKVLDAGQWDDYQQQLREQVRGKGAHPRDISSSHATAAQRAAAFLRTLNLWTTDET
jgi:hypothetical protein